MKTKLLLISMLLFPILSLQAQNSSQTELKNVPNSSNYIDLTPAAEHSVPAVVHIKTEFKKKNSDWDSFFGGSFWEDFFGLHRNNEYPVMAAGSGVIISSDGYIITNNHVVEDADKITITLNDKREFSGTIVGTDADADLAVVKIDGEGFPYLEFGNSDQVRLGEWVLAVGNPFNLTSTVTAGIVSAKARNLNILGENSSIESFIQTDAAVNQGNSGGALVNLDGKLIGINSAIASGTGYFTGYSFAIPSNVARKVAADLKEYGYVQRAYLGVSIMDIDAKTAEENKLPDLKGVLVAQVDEKGAAKQHGLEDGDIIRGINNVEVNSMSELREILMQYSPGETVTLQILHQGNEVEKHIQLLNKKGTTEILKKEDVDVSNIFGATFADITQREKSYYRITGGVKVASVGDGLFKQAGIRKGFVITVINGRVISTMQDFDKFMMNNTDKYVSVEGVYDNGYYKYTYAIQLP